MFHFLQGRRNTVLLWTGLFIALVAFIDWNFEENISFGFLYLFPMLIVGSCLNRLQMAGVAVLCTGLTEAFDSFPWSMPVGLSRLVLTFAAFFGAGLYGFESARSRRLSNERFHKAKEEVEMRRRAEEQMESLIASSPASIFTLDAAGEVQLANKAAHQLLGVAEGELAGRRVAQFLPALGNVPPSPVAPFFHTEMECRAQRQNGEIFLAHVWFSTYQTMAGPRLAAVVFDASEELRDRAEFSMQQILGGSKVLVGALCHEIRNICGAIAVVHSKLSRNEELVQQQDFEALGTLVQALKRMAGLELRHRVQSVAENLDVRSVLDELRIIVQPSFCDSEMSLRWDIPEFLPRVWADRHALLQAFLNIAKNSQRALETQVEKELVVRASASGNSVTVRFFDTGPGVANPDLLFAPFQPGAQETGLGLYLSRTFVRSFQGEIDYEPQPHGSCFAVTLALAADRRRVVSQQNVEDNTAPVTR